MSKKQAAKTYGVPQITLIFQIKNPACHAKPGPSTVLTPAEENEIIKWVTLNSRKGFPRRKEDLIASVAEFMKKNNRANPFKDGIPGDKWYKLFLNRHPELAIRTPESVTAASSCVSEDDLRHWFSNIETYLKLNGYEEILKDPSRVLNGDETNFQLCPKSGKVLAIKGEKNVYEVDQGQAKSTLTVLFTFKADGEKTPPLVIYPYKRLPKEIVTQVPKEWGIGLSDNGWMKTDIFIDYLKNILHPHLVKTNTKFPVILFVDGHKTHVTLSVSELCTKLNIILIALYPNATRILQPADVAAFKPLKNGWKKSVLEWRRNNPSEALTKLEFAPILKKALEGSIRPDILQNGFKAAGLYPWDPNNTDFKKCLGKKKSEGSSEEINDHDEGVMTKEQFLNIISSENHETEVLKKIYNHFQVPYPLRTDATVNANASFKSDINNLPEVIACSSIDSSAKDNSENACQKVNNVQDFAEYDITSLPVVFAEEWNDAENHENISLDKLNSAPMDLHMISSLPSTSNANNNQFVVSTNLGPDKIPTAVNLKDCLIVSKTPERKGIKNTERTSFVLTSEEFQKKEQQKVEEKLKKQEEIQRRKQERMLKRQQKEIKKIQPKIPPTKKIKVLSDVIINSQNQNLISKNKVAKKSDYASIVHEKIEKIKMKLKFETKTHNTENKTEISSTANSNEKAGMKKRKTDEFINTGINKEESKKDKVLCVSEIEEALYLSSQ